MNRRVLNLIGLGLIMVFSAVARADETPRVPVGTPVVSLNDVGPESSLLQDPYVRLYLARLQSARLDIERAKQNLSVALKTRDRYERLFVSNAVSAQELEDGRRDAEVANINLQAAKVAAEEAAVFVDIALSRISIGLEMPICAQIR